MFGIGMPEILLILAIALIVIGPKKLPGLAKTLGRAMGEFRRATQDFKRSIDMEDAIREFKEPFDLNDIAEDTEQEENKEKNKTGSKKHTSRESDTDNAADDEGLDDAAEGLDDVSESFDISDSSHKKNMDGDNGRPYHTGSQDSRSDIKETDKERIKEDK